MHAATSPSSYCCDCYQLAHFLRESFYLPSFLLLRCSFTVCHSGLTGSRDFTLAGPWPPLITIFFANFQVEMAVTITNTQTDVTVSLSNYWMVLLTPTSQQKNVTCTAIAFPSKEAIYLCSVVNRFLALEPLLSGQARSRDQSRSNKQELQQ